MARPLTKRQKLVAHYTTIGLGIGLSWAQARAIAREIVAEKRVR